MSAQIDTTAAIDALIDMLAELERIEVAARHAREELTPVCSALYQRWILREQQSRLNPAGGSAPRLLRSTRAKRVDCERT